MPAPPASRPRPGASGSAAQRWRSLQEQRHGCRAQGMLHRARWLPRTLSQGRKPHMSAATLSYILLTVIADLERC